MKKMILGLMALIGAALASPAMADTITPPSHVKMEVISVGKIVGNIVPVTDGKSVVNVRFDGCDIQWTTGEQFYAMTASGASPIVTKRTDFDYVWIKSGHNWQLTISTLVSANAICIVQAAK